MCSAGQIAIPHQSLGIDVDAVRDQPAHHVAVLLAGREVQGDRIAAVRANARWVILEHGLGDIEAFEVERGKEVQGRAGLLQQRDDGRIGLLLGGGGQRRAPTASVAFTSAPSSIRSWTILGRFLAAA